MLITDVQSIEGKTIKFAKRWGDDQIVLTFTDESYISLESSQNYDLTEIEVSQDVSDFILHETGAISDEEFRHREEAASRAREDEMREQQRASQKAEMAELARLKAKYEKPK